MKSITLHSHVGRDGILKLQVPEELKDVDVTVTIQPVTPESKTPTPEELGWPPGFFEQTFGSIPDLVRPPQGELQEREPLE